jgi:hypothetical protein
MKSPFPTSTKVKYGGLDVHAETLAVARVEGTAPARPAASSASLPNRSIRQAQRAAGFQPAEPRGNQAAG